jgi:ferredoxin--NADP+ reductase
MFKILEKKVLAPGLNRYIIEAPLVAKKAQPGEFIILRVDEKGERIPLTIGDFDREKGTIMITAQTVGVSSEALSMMETGDYIQDFVGPLGRPSDISKKGTVVCIGGGIGVVPVYPIARGMHENGNNVISIIGARTKDILLEEEEMRAISSECHVVTDDGSYGEKGFVTDVLQRLIDQGVHIDEVVAIGSIGMMYAVSKVTLPYKIKTVVSLDPIMVDGTGMCGCCRVEVGGETKFACVDGPDFDAHQVDFPALMARLQMYTHEERCAREVYAEERRDAECH